MRPADDQLEALRRRLVASDLLTHVGLEPAAAGADALRATASLSAAGHDAVARSGPDALRQSLAAHAGPGVNLDWRFTTGAADAWPDGIARGPRMLPAIWSWLPGDNRHRFLVDVSGDLAWLDGHFPQTPILAGVVQFHWAALLAQGVFAIAAFPRDVVRLKFQRPVLPPALLELELARIDANIVQFHFRSPAGPHSQGRMLFAEDSV